MRVLEQMVLHLPVHVYIQACLRYMQMARDCAAPHAHSVRASCQAVLQLKEKLGL